MLDKLCQIIADQFVMRVEDLNADTTFSDLRADSVDLIELAMTLEDEFGIGEMQEEDIAGITTIGDLEKYIQDHQNI